MHSNIIIIYSLQIIEQTEWKYGCKWGVRWFVERVLLFLCPQNAVYDYNLSPAANCVPFAAIIRWSHTLWYIFIFFFRAFAPNSNWEWTEWTKRREIAWHLQFSCRRSHSSEEDNNIFMNYEIIDGYIFASFIWTFRS